MEKTPPEVLAFILSFVDAASLISCSSVAKLWHELSDDNRLWKALYFAHWPLGDVQTHYTDDPFDLAEKEKMKTQPLYWKNEFREAIQTIPTKVLQKIQGEHTDEIWSGQWSPNGQYYASCGKDEQLIIWDLILSEATVVNSRDGRSTRKKRRIQPQLQKRHQLHMNATVAMLDWSPDSRYVLTTAKSCEVSIVDVTSGSIVQKVYTMPFDCHARWLADGQGFLVGTRPFHQSPERYAQTISHLRFTPSQSEQQQENDSTTSAPPVINQHRFLLNQQDYMHCMFVNHGGTQWLFTTANKRSFRNNFCITSVFCGEGGEQQHSQQQQPQQQEEKEEKELYENVEETGLALGFNFSMDDAYLLVNVRPFRTLEDTLEMLKKEKPQWLKELEEGLKNVDRKKTKEELEGMQKTLEERLTKYEGKLDRLSGFEERIAPHFELNLWNMKEMRKVKTFMGHKAWSYDGPFLCWPQLSPNQKFIATGSEDSRIFLFHRVHGTVTILEGKEGDGHSDLVDCAVWHPTIPGLLVSCADDGNIILWGAPQYLS